MSTHDATGDVQQARQAMVLGEAEKTGGKVHWDAPTPTRPHRVYAALTNHCNRRCPWCSTCSSPEGQTWLEPDKLWASLPAEGPYELQLEGGEPTLHPAFWSLVARARRDERCTRLVLCTNGVVLPRTRGRLEAWVERLGVPVTIKLSWNHHLLERDPGLPELAQALVEILMKMGGDRQFVLNVRLRRGAPGDDAWVTARAEAAGLLGVANVFYLQRYGFASEEEGWEAPHLVGYDFRLINPDGRVFGPELVARSEAMRQLLDSSA